MNEQDIKVAEAYKRMSEETPYVGEVSDHIKGIKRFLDDLESTYAYGNLSDAKKIMSNIMKQVNKLKKVVK